MGPVHFEAGDGRNMKGVGWERRRGAKHCSLSGGTESGVDQVRPAGALARGGPGREKRINGKNGRTSGGRSKNPGKTRGSSKHVVR